MFSDFGKVSSHFYGISQVPTEFWKEYGYILLNISGSDGKVSSHELEWLTVSCAEAIGIDDSLVKAWESYNYEEDDLEKLFLNLNANSLGNFNKLLIYDAIRMARADGDYADNEKEQVFRAASIMKVAPEAVNAIEALIELEEAAEILRMNIL